MHFPSFFFICFTTAPFTFTVQSCFVSTSCRNSFLEQLTAGCNEISLWLSDLAKAAMLVIAYLSTLPDYSGGFWILTVSPGCTSCSKISWKFSCAPMSLKIARMTKEGLGVSFLPDRQPTAGLARRAMLSHEPFVRWRQLGRFISASATFVPSANALLLACKTCDS